MFGLGHIDLTPLFYGVVMFLGLWSMYRKFANAQYQGFFIEVFIFFLVFKLHGGTMAGGFAAMVCALLAGFVIPKTRSSK